jgi:hypothetical protein
MMNYFLAPWIRPTTSMYRISIWDFSASRVVNWKSHWKNKVWPEFLSAAQTSARSHSTGIPRVVANYSKWDEKWCKEHGRKAAEHGPAASLRPLGGDEAPVDADSQNVGHHHQLQTRAGPR